MRNGGSTPDDNREPMVLRSHRSTARNPTAKAVTDHRQPLPLVIVFAHPTPVRAVPALRFGKLFQQSAFFILTRVAASQSTEPTALFDQSMERINAPISPPPESERCCSQIPPSCA
jgi:hypothetical protein